MERFLTELGRSLANSTWSRASESFNYAGEGVHMFVSSDSDLSTHFGPVDLELSRISSELGCRLANIS